MGYHTDFEGKFNLDKPLTFQHYAYLKKFNETRRMKRNESKANVLPDDIRRAVNLPIGVDGGYFVGGVGDFGQGNDASVLDHNNPPADQPSLWCGWVPSEDAKAIEWDGGEKFYEYIAWIDYLIKHFLEPWGYTVEGEVSWRGEERGDDGIICVQDNIVTTHEKSGKVPCHIAHGGYQETQKKNYDIPTPQNLLDRSHDHIESTVKLWVERINATITDRKVYSTSDLIFKYPCDHNIHDTVIERLKSLYENQGWSLEFVKPNIVNDMKCSYYFLLKPQQEKT